MTKATVRALAGVRFDSIDPDTLLDLGRLTGSSGLGR